MSHLNPFPKVLQKQAGRAKARLLQNLGKAERTTDEEFDLHVKNFNNQQNAGMRLQKELKTYWHCIRAMQMARKNLLDTICELYEPCWDGVQEFLVKSEVSNKHFDDFVFLLNSDVLTPVGNYLNQFPEYTNKISKRNRKLLDFDNCRHNLQNLEVTRKKDGKIVKAREQLDDASHLFELINNELHDDLPALYKSRVSFFATSLQGLFTNESAFHIRDAQMLSEFNGLLDQLMIAFKRGDYDETPCLRFESPPNGAGLPDPEYFLGKEDLLAESKQSEVSECKTQEDESCSTSGSITFSTPPTTAERNLSLDMHCDLPPTEGPNLDSKSDAEDKNKTDSKSTLDVLPKTEGTGSSGDQGSIEEKSITDPGGVPIPPPENVLYQVQGTFKYVAEDDDELSFDVGDVINVVEYDNPDEQEEGWLTGIFNGKKGLFPANFTTRL